MNTVSIVNELLLRSSKIKTNQNNANRYQFVYVYGIKGLCPVIHDFVDGEYWFTNLCLFTWWLACGPLCCFAALRSRTSFERETERKLLKGLTKGFKSNIITSEPMNFSERRLDIKEMTDFYGRFWYVFSYRHKTFLKEFNYGSIMFFA